MKRSFAKLVVVASLALGSIPVGMPSAAATDPLTISAGIVNTTLLPNDCTIGGTSPSLSGTNVVASGDVRCSETRSLLVVETCIQHRQPLVSENVSWQDLACNAGRAQNTTSASASVSGKCIPGEWSYRTVVIAEVHRGDHVQKNGTGLAVIGPVTLYCPIASQ